MTNAAAETLIRFPFGAPLRQDLAAQCAAFPRRDPAGGAHPLKRAAVAIVVLADEAECEACVMLTVRAMTLRSHGGQWALPGGRLDEAETPVAAALRELREEVRLDLAEAHVLGTLDDYPTRSGYLMTPVVVWADSLAGLAPNPEEVAAIHRIPFGELLAPDTFDFVAIPESDRPAVRAHLTADMIHAPTAALLYQFRELVAGRVTRVDHLEQPVFAWR